MLGCRIETAIGTTAIAHLASFGDWLDFDASLLVTKDPFQGVVMDENAMIHLPQGAGIGIMKLYDQL